MKPLIILLTNVLAHSEVPERLALYKDRVHVAVLDVQGSSSIEERLSECINTMMTLPISHFLLRADEAGGYAYLISQSEGGFPNLRKLRSTLISGVHPPDDGFWEAVEVDGFCKPQAGMIDCLETEIQPTHTLLVIHDSLDEETADNVSLSYGGELHRQSTQEWLEQKNPDPWHVPLQQSSSGRRFECVDRSRNSSKFWEIELHPKGLGFQTRYGRIGTAGQTNNKTFPNPAAAQRAYHDIIQSKLRKGYIEV